MGVLSKAKYKTLYHGDIKKYRGQGLSKKLVNNAISFAKKDNKLEYLRWLADKDNIVSINLARSCGFKQSEITDNEIIFKYPL